MGFVGKPLIGGGLGDAEINDLGDRHAVVQGDQNIGGLDVAVDDALLVGVLDGLANLDEPLEALAGVLPISNCMVRFA